uniref:Uncharacterized protein n=1 Tax=Solanum tuberosum TaxID=4113 RepID=M1B4C6_SOLTU
MGRTLPSNTKCQIPETKTILVPFPGLGHILYKVTSRASEISHNVSKHLVSAPERNSESYVADISDNTNKFELPTKNFAPDVEKNQRGKGSNGGGTEDKTAHVKNKITIANDKRDAKNSLEKMSLCC